MAQVVPVVTAPTDPAVARAPRAELYWYELGAAVRGIVGAPRYAVPALVSLALALGAATLVFSIWSAQVLRPLPFEHGERLVQVELTGSRDWTDQRSAAISPMFVGELRQLDSVFESIGVLRYAGGRLTGHGDPKSLSLQLTSLDFFDALGVTPVQGRAYSARGPAPDGLDGIVLREGFWREALGGADVVGKTVLVDDVPKTVLGIIPDDQAIPSWGSAWAPERLPDVPSRFWLVLNHAIGRLKPGVSLEHARERLRARDEALRVRDREGSWVRVALQPLRDVFVGERKQTVSVMLVAVLGFLLLACANVAALLGARASVRAHEHAVRSALGASRASLARQSAFEAVILVLVGGGLGLWPAVIGMRVANEEYLDWLGNTPARLDLWVVAGFAGLLLLAALTAALTPVLLLRRVQPMDALRAAGKTSESRRARRVREALVALQVAATVALLVSAGLVVRSVRAMLAVDAGIDVDGVVIGSVIVPTETRTEGSQGYLARRAELERTVRALRARLERLPNVAHACVAGDLPFDFMRFSPSFEGDGGRPPQPADSHWIAPGCLATFGTRLLAGRDFDEHEPDGVMRAIVNRAFAEQVLGTSEPLGRRFRFARPPDAGGGDEDPGIEIIGMTEDALELDLTARPAPAVYLPLLANAAVLSSPGSARFAVAVKARGDHEPLQAALPKAVAEVQPGAVVFDVDSLLEFVKHTFRERTVLERTLLGFGLSAIVLAAVGLFGITAYSVAERTPEVGIRRALGATEREVLGMVVRQCLAVVAIGAALGVLLAQLARGLLEGFLFGVTANDPATYAAVLAGVLLVTLLAALGPARTAAAVSPTRALSAPP